MSANKRDVRSDSKEIEKNNLPSFISFTHLLAENSRGFLDFFLQHQQQYRRSHLLSFCSSVFSDSIYFSPSQYWSRAWCCDFTSIILCLQNNTSLKWEIEQPPQNDVWKIKLFEEEKVTWREDFPSKRTTLFDRFTKFIARKRETSGLKKKRRLLTLTVWFQDLLKKRKRKRFPSQFTHHSQGLTSGTSIFPYFQSFSWNIPLESKGVSKTSVSCVVLSSLLGQLLNFLFLKTFQSRRKRIIEKYWRLSGRPFFSL